MRFSAISCAVCVTIIISLAIGISCHAQAKPKLPKEKQLDRDVQFTRDPANGEVRVVPAHSKASEAPAHVEENAPHAIRSEVSLVQAGCSAVEEGGTFVRSLTQSDFTLRADSAPQGIAHFDASTEPAHIVLLLDASPSEYHALENMKASARALSAQLSPQDEVAVVAFAGHPHLLLPFSTDRTLLEEALTKVELMRNIEEIGSNIYGSVFLAADELLSGPHSPSGRKAIILLSDGQDTGLKLSWDPASMFPPPGGANFLTFEDVVRELAATGTEVFAISTENRPKGMTAAWLEAHRGTTLIARDSRRLEIPSYTIYLAELVRRAGGGLYFLREIGALSDVYARIAAELRTEYTLGFYPDGKVGSAGWHQLQIGLTKPQTRGTLELNCRPSYYIPASR